MFRRLACFAALIVLSGSDGTGLFAQEAEETGAEETRAIRRAQMVQLVDSIVEERLKRDGIEPAAPASDDEFLRRASLDLSGVIPSASRAREYLLSDDPAKHETLVEELLRSPRFATHQADLWSARMLADPNSLEAIGDREELRRWFRTKFRENYRYDRLVAEFVSASGTRATGPNVFYRRQEYMPEKLAASTSRIFLGMQMDCAQCHDHPFDKWSQKDFWALAAFFARVGSPGMENMAQQQSLVEREEGEVMLPETDEVVPPRFPGSDVAVEEFGGRRTQLAIWLTGRDNPYLAKAAVNRVWSQLFGEGIVEPVDDLSPRNAPSHPELLDALADWFIETGYDLKELYRTLALTKTYARSSRYEGTIPPRRLWAYVPVKSLTPEQLYDSIVSVGGGNAAPVGPAGIQLGDQGRAAFAARMAFLDRPATEYQGGIPQALMFLNGDVLRGATSPSSRIVGALSAPIFTNEERVDALYVATLSRFPTPEERDLALAFYEGADSPDASTSATGDLLWTLFNSGEFAMRR